MSISHLFSLLDESGIRVQLQDNHLKIHAPKGKLTPDLVNELRDKKDEIIVFLKKHVQKPEKYEQIVPVEKKEYYPVSSAQKRLYILYRLNKESTGYNMPSVLELKNEAEWDKHGIEDTFRRLVYRHESFRTSFEIINEDPVQRIKEGVEIKVKVDDYEGTRGLAPLSTLPDPNTQLVTNAIKSFIRPFDLSKAPLLRVGMIPIEKEKCMLLVDMHHIISDGMSIEILKKEFMALHQGDIKHALPKLKLQYKDYSEWQRQRNEKEQVAVKQQTYWLNEFAGERPILDLPYDYQRPGLQSFEGETITFELEEQEMAALNRLVTGERVTLFTILLALFNILLGKLSGQEDIVIGTPTAGRVHPDLEPVIGMFVNTLALRNYPLGEKNFNRFLTEVNKSTLKAFENQDYPFETLVEKVVEKRDAGHNPLFDIMFALHNMRNDAGTQSRPGTYAYENKISRFDMLWMGTERGERIDFEIEYCTKLFKRETIEKFFAYFKKIVTVVTNEPGIPISRIEIISAEERKQVLYDFNETATEYPPAKTIHALFQEQVQRTPDNIAVIGPSKIKYRTYITYLSYISYRELNEKSNQLAHLLIEKGVRPDTIAGIMVERSIEMIVGILGILKAGGAYLPIDPAYPQARVLSMLNDSGASLLLSQRKVSASFNAAHGIESEKYRKILFIDEVSQPVNPYPGENPGYLNQPHDLLYVIYTSGSTGKPKGVMLNHGNFANLIYYQFEHTGIDFSAVLQFTTISFDVSAQEIFSTLLAGGRLSLVSKETLTDIPTLLNIVEKDNIKTLFLPASFLKFVMNEKTYARLIPGCVTHIVTAGEQVIINETFRHYLKKNDVSFHNHYGPSETHVVTTLTLKPAETVPDLPPIGRPVSNSAVYILDKGMNPLPVKVPGELFIGGIQVGRGYLNNPELTAERYCLRRPGGTLFEKTAPPGPPRKNFSLEGTRGLALLLNINMVPGKRGYCYMSYVSHRSHIYRTGDLARWLPDGNIEFLGRIDHQVKIRGSRVELGEIESYLLNNENIKEAVVIAKNSESGEKYLCAYFVASNRDRELVPRLKEFLSVKLPDYMLPSYFVQLEKIPLTPNGKIDRKSLPEPQRDVGENYVAPGNQIQMKLVEMWSQILGTAKDIISIDSNFFELGGQSLKATILITKIHQYFNVKLSLAEIFKQPTIRALAGYIKDAKTGEYSSIKPLEKKEYYPLSSPQKRLYILQQIDPTSTVYHISHGIELNTGDDRGNLEEIFWQLIRRHESFRTSFLTVNEEPAQRIHEEMEFKIEYSQVKVEDSDTEGTRGLAPLSLEPAPPTPHPAAALISSFIRPFDLSKAPLLRVRLIQLDKKKHILLLDMHHIISDGTSMKILMEEFQKPGDSKELPELRIRYKDYARWQTGSEIREWINHQEKYWLNEFSNEIPVLNLTTDYIRPAVQSFEGAAVGFEIEHEQTTRLKTLALKHHATLFMALFSVFNILLSKLSRQEDIVIGIPTAGRRHADLQQIIGMFVNTLALRNYPLGEKSFTGFLSEIKKSTLEAFENQDYPLEELVEKAVVRRDTGRNPLFDVMFTLQDISEKTGARMKSGTYHYENSVARFDMAWMAAERGERINFEIEYCTKLFKRETIERFFAYFKKIVTAVTNEPGIPISRIEIISVEERKKVLYDFNDTTTEYPRDKAIHTLFREQAQRIPDHMAVVGMTNPGSEIRASRSEGTRGLAPLSVLMSITYSELNESANRLAHILVEKGVGPDSIVGIIVERSIEMILGILGILKAGGAYLPIDPEYPEERIKYILKDSRTKTLVTIPGLSEKLKKLLIVNGQLLIVNGSPPNRRRLDNPPKEANLINNYQLTIYNLQLERINLAYIIYTSGSTGRPKGVLVRHQNVVRLVKNSNFIDFTPDDRLLLTGAIGFDITTFEIWWPLLNGLTLFLADQHVILDAHRLGNFMIKNKISILHLIPGLFNQLALQRLETFTGLTYFLVGGDLVQPQYINLLRNTCKDVKILHMYGPTENTTFSTFHPVNQDYDSLIPIGKPIGNSFVYIADKFDKLVPVGVPGELLVGGEGVARGYLNNPELTAERFCLRRPGALFEKTAPGPRKNFLLEGTRGLALLLNKVPGKDYMHPCNHAPMPSPHSPIYFTGDLGRWLWDGNIEFLGRIDSQVKIRGFRIEPGEIENQLLNHKKIKETLVTLYGPNQKETGEQYLCAYIVPAENQPLEPTELRNHLAEKIPGYMIPSYFVLLDNIPLTANGKVDLKALPAPGAGEPGKIVVGPRSPIEKKLVNIWAEVLKLPPEKIGIDNNFFELGGHSLKAAQLMAKIQSQFNTGLSLQEIFKFPTIRQLAAIVSIGETSTSTVPNVEKQEYYEVSYNQERLWNFQRPNPGSDAYNIFGKISFNRDIYVKRVRETLFRLIRRHESFRTRFGEINGQPVQFIETNVTIPLEIIDLSFLQEEKKELETEKIYKENSRKPFDLTCAPLFRAVLLKLGTGSWDFIFVMHHIISDGWSHELLKKEFLAFYNGFLTGQDITLPPLQFRYRDFSLWQRQWSNDPSTGEEVLNYWRSKLEKGFPELQLPFDRNGDPNDHSGITFRSVVPPDIKKSLQLLGETHHTSLFMILFSAFNRYLFTISGQEDIVCRVPAAGRDQPSLQGIMGYLVNPIFLKNQVKHNERFIDLLHRVAENTLEAFRYQWYPFEQVLEKLGWEYPGITVSFNMLSMQEREAETDLEQWDSFFTGDTGDVKFTLTLRITVYRNGIEIFWNAQKSLFKPATLENMARQYVRVLKMISKENQDF